MQNTCVEKKGLIVCADDFGMSSGINEGILGLAENRRISAVSCLVRGEAWEEGYKLLKDFQENIDIGLHLSFSEYGYLNFSDYPDKLDKSGLFYKVVKSVCAGKGLKERAMKEFRDQMGSFYEKMGRWPDFIDGHMFIHQLPVFSSAVVELAAMVPGNKVYVRNSAISLRDIFRRKTAILKNIAVSILGAAFKRELLKKRISTNTDLLGVRSFNAAGDFAVIFESFLKAAAKEHNSIFITHPAAPPGFNREREMRYLMSDDYKAALKRYGFYLSRFER